MSTFIIGLDINDNHVTSALIRVEKLTKKILCIERDTYFTRSYDIYNDTNPREIIEIWIQCIDDLLLDFTKNYQENDKIIGISIGIPGPMDYESGISYIQSPAFEQFFGLNLRLSIQYGLKELVSRWKHNYYDKYCSSLANSSSKNVSILDKLRKKQQPRRLTLTPPLTPRLSNVFIIPPTIVSDDDNENEFSEKNLKDFCGTYDTHHVSIENLIDDVDTSICRSRRDTYFHDIEISPSKKILTNDNFNPTMWAIIEELVHIPISFYNDAICFGLGEINNDYNQNYERILALTISTTFGSAFIERGEIIKNREDVPPNGTLWNCPYDEHSIADDWFSTRGLINLYKKFLQHTSPSNDHTDINNMEILINEDQQDDNDDFMITDDYLVQQAANGDLDAIKAIQTFAGLLGKFLIPYINKFQTHLIVISGKFAQVKDLLENELNLTIKNSSKVQIYFSFLQQKSICFGAVQQQLYEERKNIFRQSHQYLLPIVKRIDTSQYDIYPSHQIPLGNIHIGYQTLNEKFFHLLEENQILLIDGFVGTYFNEYSQQLNEYYFKKTHEKNLSLSSLLFYDSRIFLETNSNIQKDIYLKDPESLFGKLTSDLDFKKDFINIKNFEILKRNLSYPCVIIGPGSSYINQTSPLIYIDIPKNELYYRISSQTAYSYLKPIEYYQSNYKQLPSKIYEIKCLYFLDYPIFNKLKQELLPRLNYFIDSQRPNCPTWIDGHTFRQALNYIANQPIRVRPWFEPGPWGGQWLKTICKNLSQHTKNYAWSYEMVTSENGLILSDNKNHLLELSWDIFYGSQSNKILGNDNHYRLFNDSNDFPIRFDLLDTMDGGNLALQCSPNLEYIKKNFGEKFPQDETYYIIETKQNLKEEYKNDKTLSSFIYLGFNKNIKLDEFYQSLILSDTRKRDLNIDKYIQSISTNIHEFYLIPNQTIHAAGRNQVILEISSKPYIYTFKLYDWLRLGLDGQPRILSIEDGIKNLQMDRKPEQLRCQPIRLKYEENKYEEQHLPTHNLHYFDVERLIIEPNESIEIIRTTENRFHLCMLVEGDAIEIEFSLINNNNQEKQIRQYNYIETFLIPASIHEYRLRPIIKNKNNEKKSSQFILLIAFLKWNCEKLLE